MKLKAVGLSNARRVTKSALSPRNVPETNVLAQYEYMTGFAVVAVHLELPLLSMN